MTRMVPTVINNRWKVILPEHRAKRPEWKDWETLRLDSMHRNINKDDIVYDVGTEEGDISALIASWIGKEGPGGMVLIEPNAVVWPHVPLIWQENDLKDPLSSFWGFVSEENVHEDSYDFNTWPQCVKGDIVAAHDFCQLGAHPDIPQIRLDELVLRTEYVPTVLNIDVEGAEFAVLLSATATLQVAKPLIYVSIHPELKTIYEFDPQELHEFMGMMGYRVKHLGDDHESHYVFWHPEGRELRL